MRTTWMLAAMISVATLGCDGDSGVTEPVSDVSDVAEDAQDVSDAGETPEAGETTEPRADLAWEPELPGPYHVGVRTFDVTYQPDGVDGTRTVELLVWYPTEDTTGTTATYFNGLLEDEEAFRDASLAAPVDGEAYPVMMYSHGHLGFAATSAFLMRHMASHGWVVAAPEHTGNTLADGPDRKPAIYFLRAFDVSASMDFLGALPASDPLAGTLALDRVIVSGHSFGGYTAFTLAGAEFDVDAVKADICVKGDGGACTPDELAVFEAGVADPRVIGIVPMAAGDYDRFGDAGLAAMTLPVLMMTAEDDEAVADGSTNPLWLGLGPGDRTRVHIMGGCHQTFALGGCVLDDATGTRIVDTYALAFSRRFLLGDEPMDAYLDGTTTVDDAVVLSTK